MNGWEYETYCAGFLRQQGFSATTVTPGSGDQGADVIAWKGGRKYAVQCKHYAGHPVGNKAVQEAIAGRLFYECDRAMVMTSSTFTKSARELAKKADVELWERIVPVGNAVVQLPPGKKAPSSRLLWAWAAILVMVGLGLIGLVGALRDELPAVSRTDERRETPVLAPGRPEIVPYPVSFDPEPWEGNAPDNTVYYTRSTVKEMLLRFQQDADAACETYGGKHLKLTGYLAELCPEEGYVTLEVEQFRRAGETVLCTIANEEQLRRVNTLSEGGYVTVWGVCEASPETGYTVRIHCISP